jgi:superfamily II DNA helicase RecQ
MYTDNTFRVAFKNIGELIKNRNAKVVCMTATASTLVQKFITQELGFK